MKRLRVILLTILIVFVLVFPARAFVPLAIPAGYWVASAVLHVAAAGVGIYYAMKPAGGSSHIVDNNGNVYRKSQVAWIDLTASPPAVVQKNITAKLTNDKMRELATSSPSKYPKINASMIDPGTPPGPSAKTYTIGEKVFDASRGLSFTVSSMDWVYDGPNGGITNPAKISGNQMFIYTQYAGNNTYNRCTAYGLTAYTPVPAVASPQKQALNLSGLTGATSLPPDTPVNSTYQAELDKMMQDPSYVPSFTDDTTGLPYAPPPSSSVASPTQVDAYNKNGLSSDASTASDSATQSSVDSRTAARDQAQTNLNANPGDPALQQKLKDAQAALDRALADQAKQKADQAASDAKKAQDAADEEKATADANAKLNGNNTYDQNIDSPDKKSISTLLTGFVNSSPIIAMIRGFGISTSSSTGVVNLGNFHGKDLIVDFTKWQAILVTFGTMFLAIAHGFAIFVVVKGW